MKIFSADNLGSLANVAHGFFTRQGGVSEGIYSSLNCGPGSGDTREAVIENRRRALAQLGGAGHELVTLYQVHGAAALCVNAAWRQNGPPRADAMATRVPGIALGVLTADCVPVLLADETAGVVGAAHAGWRGALAGILEAALFAMEELGAFRARIVAGVGPSIAQKSYEVGDDLRTQFLDSKQDNARFFEPGGRAGHWHLDLAGYVTSRLKSTGVANISAMGLCTYACEDEFFSFRRATHRGERDYGRQLSAIMLRG